MIEAVKKITDQALRLGISGYGRKDRRRLSLVNLAGYLAALSSLSYAVNFTLYDFTNLMPLIFGNLGSALVTGTIAFWHRFNASAGAFVLSFTVASTLFYFVSMLGTDSGVHLNYIGAMAGVVAIFGLKHYRLILLVGISCIALNIACESMFETGSLQWAIDDTFMSRLYFMSATSISIIVALVVWYAFRIAEDAEKRSEQLLLNIFPRRIAYELRHNPDLSIADRFDEATVMFADIVGFTAMANTMNPGELVAFLNRIFTEFDMLCTKNKAEKIKTIGDAYMAVCGAPDPSEDHARRIMALAIDMMAATRGLSEKTGHDLELRIGIATGPITAGVIGKSKFAYDVWATTVNVASRLQSTGKPGRIHVSNSTYIALREHYNFAKAPKKQLKGFATQPTWFLKQ